MHTMLICLVVPVMGRGRTVLFWSRTDSTLHGGEVGAKRRTVFVTKKWHMCICPFVAISLRVTTFRRQDVRADTFERQTEDGGIGLNVVCSRIGEFLGRQSNNTWTRSLHA